MNRRIARGGDGSSIRKEARKLTALGRATRRLVEPLEQRLLMSGIDVVYGGVDFSSTDSTKLSALNTVLNTDSGEVSLQATVNVLNQSFSAMLDVTAGGSVVSPQFTITASNASYTLSDSGGNSLVSYFGGGGSFMLSSAGIKGAATGSVNVTIPDVSLATQNLALDVDSTTSPGELQLSGDLTDLSIAGQSLSGTSGATFDFHKSGTDASLEVKNAGFALGPADSPVVTVSQLGGSLTVAKDGISGSIGATLGVHVNDAGGNPIVDLTGGIKLSVSGGLLEVATPSDQSITANVYANGQPFISLGGAFDFTVGSATSTDPGFKLKSFTLSAGGFSISQSSAATPGNTPAPGGAMTTGNNAAPAASSDTKIGPLMLVNAAPHLNSFDFTGGTLSFDLGLTADSAALDFGGSGSDTGDNPGGVHAQFKQAEGSMDPGLSGSFGLSIPVTPAPGAGTTGKFNFTAQEFDFSIANAVTGTFTGVQIGYDPSAGPDQQIVSLNSGNVVIPKLSNLTFGIQPAMDGTPGLVVTGQGVHFANLSVTVPKMYTIGPVSFENPTVTLSNFGVTYANGQVGANFGNSTLSVSVDNPDVTISSFHATGTKLTATLQFASGTPSGFSLSADGLDLKFGSLLDIKANNVTITPTAMGTDPVLSVTTATASLDIPKTGLNLSGTVGNFEVLADGSFSQVNGDPFFVDLSLSAQSGNAGSELEFPSIFPLTISQFKLEWADIKDDPSNFTIDISAAIDTKIAGMQLDASVTNAVIDVPKLVAGQFPVTSIDSVTGSVSGTLFGAGVTASIAGGVVQADANGLRIPPGNPDHVAVANSIFYMGMSGGLSIPGLPSLGVQFGFSQLGPLSVYFSVDDPYPGLIIEPDSGLAIGSLRGGITFNASPLPVITDARQLKLSTFSPPNKLTPEQWNLQMQQQVINQLGGGAGLIFSIAPSVTDLTDSSTSIPADVSTAFSDNNYPLSNKATIANTQAGTWVVTDGAQQYEIRAKSDGGYLVSQLLLTFDPSLLPASGGAIPQGLLDAFSAVGISLSPSTTAALDPMTNQWTLTSNGVKYVLDNIGTTVAVTGGAGSTDQMNSVLRIDAGATIFDAYASEDALKIDGDITILTNGQLFVSGALTIGDSLTIQSKLYADFRTLVQGANSPTGGKLIVDMLTDFPDPAATTPTADPLLSIYGTLQLSFLDGSQQIIKDPVHSPPASAVQIELSGGAQINAFDQQQVNLNGDLLLKFSSKTFTLNLIDATLGVQGLVSGNLAQASGALTIDTTNGPQVFGALKVNVTSSNLPQLADAGISFGGDAFIRFNSTPDDKTVPLTVHNPDGSMTQVDASLPHEAAGLFLYGHVTFSQGGVAADLSGAFGIQYAAATGLDVFLAATLQLTMQDKPIFGFSALGVLVVQNDGNFALFGDLERSASVTQGDLAFNGSVDLSLYANTTGHDVTYTVPKELRTEIDADPSLSSLLAKFANSGTAVGADSISFTVPGGAPPADPAQPAPSTGVRYVAFRGQAQLDLLDKFTVDGSMYAAITPSDFLLTANGTLAVPDLGSVGVGGTIHISAAGVAAALRADVQAGTTFGSGDGVDLTGAFSLVLNTTDQYASLNVPANGGGFTLLPNIDPYSVRVHVEGSVNFVNLATGTGSADVMYANNQLGIHANVDVSLADAIQFHVDATALVFADGVALDVSNISVNAGIDVGGILNLNATATGKLTINTTHRYVPIAGDYLSPRSFHLDLSANVDLLSVLTLSGEVIIDASNGNWSVTVPQDNPLSVDFFHIGTISTYGSFNSAGAFSLTFTGSIFLGDPRFLGLGGTGTLYISDDPGATGVPTGLTISGSGSGGLYIANQNLLGGSVDFLYSSDSGDLNARVGWDDLFGHHTQDFYVGYFPASNIVPPPPPVYLGGNLNSPQSVSGGVLYINAGDSRAQYRNFDTGEVNENVYLVGSDASGGAQTITVWMLGKTQTFSNVTGVVFDGGSGDDYAYVDGSVLVPVNVDLGTGNNQVDDYSPTGDTLTAGGGNDTINGGPGADTITVGTGTHALVSGGGGADAITVDVSGVDGASYSVSEPAGDVGSSLVVQGRSITHRFDLSSKGPTTGTVAVNPTFSTPDHVTYSGLGQLVVNTASYGDVVNVLGTVTSTLIEGGVGQDTINVGSNAPGTGGTLRSLGAPLFISGSGDTTVNVDDTGEGAASGALAAGQITGFGSNGIYFSGLKALNLALGSGGNTLDVYDTPHGIPVSVTSGDGADTFNVHNDSGPLSINAGGGNDVANVLATSGSTTIDTGAGANTVNLGSTAPHSGGVLDSLQGPVTITGHESDVLNVDDTGTTSAKTGTLTPTTLTGFGQAGITYGGIAALNLNLGSGGNTLTINDINPATQKTIDGGTSASDTVNATFASDFNGRLDLTSFEHGSVNVNGNLNGTLTDTAPGYLESVNVGGSITGAGRLIAGSIDQAQVGLDLAGSLLTAGALANLSVGRDLSGLVSETGTVQDLIVAGSITPTGTFQPNGDVTNASVGKDIAGTVTVAGSIAQLSVGGNVSGCVKESGSSDQITIGGSLTPVGTITAADIGALSVSKDLAGTVAVGGTLASASVGGDLSGKVSETGTINQFAISGSLTPTGTISAVNPTADSGNIGALSIGHDLAGSVLVSGTLGTLQVGGNLSGSVLETGTIQQASVGGSITPTGLLSAVNASNPSAGNINALLVGQDLAGTVKASGRIGSVTVGNGSFTPTGTISAGTLDTFNVGPNHLSVGQNLAGSLTVQGTLGSVRVAGGTPGTITAGHIGTVAAYGGYGPVVGRIIENGTERRIELASPTNPYPLPDPTVVVTGPYVNVQYFYESGALVNPQLTARLTNGVGSTRDQYDLSLVAYNAAAKFNLARLDSAGVAGVRNVSIEGDLLSAVTAQASTFLGLPGGAPAGVRLPQEDLAGVAIRDFAPNYEIQAHSIQAIAFGLHPEWTWTETGADSDGYDAAQLLTPGTAIAPANDTFRVPFTGQSPDHVALFLSTAPFGGFFDSRNVAFTIQGVRSPNATFTANVVTPSNVARGADTALVTVAENYDRYHRPLGSTVQSIAIRGDGASVQTQQYVANSITSTGPLGDLTLLSPQGITNVTAPSIFGSINAAGPITGTVQTTGLRTDPITAVTSTVPADLGSDYVATSWFGPYVTSTTIDSEGGLQGRIISRGNLVSSITSDGGISGVIAAQGNLGAVAGPSNTRVGGILSNGNFSGQLVVLGSELGDVVLHGGLKVGRVAVKGGIFGNLLINGGLDSSAALVSGGPIGSPAAGTRLTVTGRNAGIVAAKGTINAGQIGGVVFNNVGATPGNPNAAAIDAIFTQQSAPLALDALPQDLQGLSSILQDLAALRLNGKGILTGPVG